MWQYDGSRRPPFAESPGPGQESVWDYPRPPRCEPETRRVVVRAPGSADDAPGDLVADSTSAVRVLETASPPTVYLPPADLTMELERLDPRTVSSFCEWKGRAHYLALPGRGEPVGWFYPEPTSRFADLRDRVAFYPGRVACFLEGERVRPQEGGFYGGWVTDDLVGPWKGGAGSGGW